MQSGDYNDEKRKMCDMTIKNYLESLSKEELLSLLLRLSETNNSVKDYLSEKIDLVQSPEEKYEIPLAQETHPTPSSCSDISKTIIRQSSPQEKINLYKSLFVGRTDVFALRWFNAKSNKSGYSPVCANKWVSGKCDLKKYSCATCPFKMPVALNDTYIFNHLAGRDEFCRDVIGLYPLMEGNLCRFLAMDFDSHANENAQWKKDVLAVQRAFSDFGIPSYIEVSRSGNGGHLWIFFDEAISARLARNLGSAIIKSAMQRRHSIPFESFDRFFPNQDEIPTGGYGNLIALPLQGRAVKDGHSVFVDENFMPYSDQWKFLSGVQKVTEKIIRKVISEIENSLPDFVEKDDSAEVKMFARKQAYSEIVPAKNESLSQSDFKDCVQIVLSNYVQIKKSGVSEKALGVFRRTAVFLNPLYFKNLRMHLPLYDIPRYIDCSKETDEYLLLPRGNLYKVTEKLDEAKAKYTITDERECGQEINLHFTAELYSEQRDALKDMLKSDMGILSAGTGFGKTVVASALIAERKTNALILVQTHALLEQWKKSIKQFLDFTAGTIAAGKDKSTGIVDIAIVNSLIEKKSDEVKARSHKYGLLIIDEAHHVSAFSAENLVASFSSKYVYGLTATPVRRDGHQKIIFYQCGPLLYSTTSKQMNERQNFAHYFIPRFTSFHYLPEIAESKTPSINRFYEKLIQNPARNELIVKDVKSAVENGRTPLVLSERIEHLNLLYDKLSDCARNVILITGKGTQKQKNEMMEKLRSVPENESLIILATGKYAGEGFDYPRIDTLFVSMPFSWKGTLAQYCGRLHRNFSGKEEVVIFDYVDYRLPVFDRMYQNRLKGYRQLGYSVKSDTDEREGMIADSKLFTTEDYKSDFEKDILSASSKIVISANYLSKVEVQNFILLMSVLLSKGVNVFVFVTKAKDDPKQKKLILCKKLMEDVGIKVFEKEELCQKVSVIDEKILWYGNVNFLGYTEKEECCMRIVEPKIASEIEGEIAT